MPHSEETLARKDYNDYEFILQEIGQLAVLNGPELMKYYSEHRHDALHMLQASSGNYLPATNAATGRFEQIVSRGLAALGKEGHRFDPNKVLGALKREFAVFLENPGDRTLTDENAHDLFKAAVQSVGSSHEALTHYIPCSVVAEVNPDRFTIGPVTFSLMEHFLKEHSGTLRQSGHWLGEKGFAVFESLFSEFLWVASIAVPKCDLSVSRERASTGVQAALDLFKLFVGGDRARYVGHAYSHAPRFKLANLASSDLVTFRFSFSAQSPNAIVADDWFRYFSRAPEWKVANALLLAYWHSWGRASEPVVRFGEALAWHGDAISERDANARVVKFWTAIERVVTLKEGDPVVARAATISIVEDAEDAKWLSYCQKSYGQRSNIVHGAKRYDALQSGRIAARAESLSRNVLLGYLSLARAAGSLQALTREHLERVFRKIDKIGKDAGHGTV